MNDTMRSGVQRALDMEEVPAEKFGGMVVRTGIGFLFVGGAVLGLWKLAWPWWVGVPLGVVGATVWSGQVVTGAIMALIQPAKAIRKLVKGSGA